MKITSINNPKVAYWAKLKMKKYRDVEHLFIVESENLVNEALKKGIVKEIITTEDKEYKVDTYNVTPEIMAKISSLVTPNKVMAVCNFILPDDIKGNVLLLDHIQDPGNLGTIIRSCVGFDVDTLVLGDTCVDLYNDKVLRASEGNIFKLDIVRMDLKDVMKTLKEKDIVIYGTDVNDGENIDKVENNSSFALVMGNEGNGVSDEVKALVDKNLYIKTSKKLESLNVGVATGIILYELNK